MAIGVHRLRGGRASIQYRREEEAGGAKAKCKVGNTKTRFYLPVSGTHTTHNDDEGLPGNAEQRSNIEGVGMYLQVKGYSLI